VLLKELRNVMVLNVRRIDDDDDLLYHWFILRLGLSFNSVIAFVLVNPVLVVCDGLVVPVVVMEYNVFQLHCVKHAFAYSTTGRTLFAKALCAESLTFLDLQCRSISPPNSRNPLNPALSAYFFRS
jgi:hypothetical protein